MNRKSNSKQDNYVSHDKNNQKYSYQFVSRPIKSPSPDRKPTNIIISTKSPEVSQYRRESTSSQEESGPYKYAQKDMRQKYVRTEQTPKQEKEYSHLGHSYKQHQTYETSKKQERGVVTESRMITSLGNSRLRNIKIQIATDYPEEFEVRNTSSAVRQKHYSESQYQKIIRTKQETIRELKQIIDLIKRNNNNANIVVQEEPSRKYQQVITELNNDVKELKIENQYLLKIIEKSKYMGENTKDVILQRQIRELKESLRYKEIEIQDVSRQESKLRKQYQGLQKQNMTLLKILKERQESEHKHSPHDKEKLSLIRIKQQHQQNLKITNELFYSEIKNIQQGYFGQIQQLNTRLDSYSQKLNKLQYSRHQLKNRGKADYTEEYDEKERHKEIQSILLSKTSRYETQISYYKNQSEYLNKQLARIKAEYQAIIQQNLSSSKVVKVDEPPKMENSNAKVRQEYEQLVVRYKKGKENNDSLTSHIQRLSKQYELLSQECNQHKNEINYLRSQLRNANKLRQDISLKCQQVEEEAQSLNNELNRLKQQYADLQEKYNKNQNFIISLSKNQPSNNKEDPYYRKKLQKEISEMSSKNAKLEQQIENLRKLYDKEKQYYESELLKQENKIEILLYEYESNMKQERRKHDEVVQSWQRKVESQKDRYKELGDQTDKDKLDTQVKMRRAFELYDQQIDKLKQDLNKRNQQLYNITMLLENNKKQAKNSSPTDSYEKELKSLLSEYNSLKQKCNRLQSNTSTLQGEIIELDTNLTNKTSENGRLYEQNEQLNKMILALRQQINVSLRGLKQKESIVSEINNLKIQINQYHIEINKYNVEISSLKQENYYLLERQQEKDREYNSTFVSWRKTIQEKDRMLQETTQKLNASLNQLQQKNKAYEFLYSTYETIQHERKNMSKINYENIEEELKQLKQYIQDHLLSNQGRLFQSESIEEYYKLTNAYEIKIQENTKLLKTIEELKSELITAQKDKLVFHQKISLLENNILIYERELKERKQIYEQLLLEKSRIQKELFLSRRVKIEHSSSEDDMKRNMSGITQRIDRLLQMQRQRNQEVHNLVDSTSKVITVSKSHYYKEE